MTVINTETPGDFLIDGLKNAHAMEAQAITLTTAQAASAKLSDARTATSQSSS